MEFISFFLNPFNCSTPIASICVQKNLFNHVNVLADLTLASQSLFASSKLCSCQPLLTHEKLHTKSMSTESFRNKKKRWIAAFKTKAMKNRQWLLFNINYLLCFWIVNFGHTKDNHPSIQATPENTTKASFIKTLAELSRKVF